MSAVRHLSSLEVFASCSSRAQSSLVIGWRDKDSRSVRLTTVATQRGVWDMDHHRGLNLIGGDGSPFQGLKTFASCCPDFCSVVAATAGLDHQVLLWNPWTSEPLCVLRGHASPVTAVRFVQSRQELFSYSKDKVCVWCPPSQEDSQMSSGSGQPPASPGLPLTFVLLQVLCLWDLSCQLCLHRLTNVFPTTREETHVVLFLQEERRRLLLSFNSLLLLLEADRGETGGTRMDAWSHGRMDARTDGWTNGWNTSSMQRQSDT